MNFIKFLAEANDISNFKVNGLERDYVIFMIPPSKSVFRNAEEDVYGFINHVKVVEYAIYYTFYGRDYIIGIKNDVDVEINDNEEEILYDKNKYATLIVDTVINSMETGNFTCESHEDGSKVELRRSQLQNMLAMISHSKQYLIQQSGINFDRDRVELIHDDNG